MPDGVVGIANSIALWAVAFIVVSVVFLQAVIFFRIAKKAAPGAGLTNHDIKSAMKVSFVTSIGPSLAVGIVVISLITLLGSPMVLLRLGIIGSAQTETGAAEVGSKVAGIPLGSELFTPEAFAIVVWTMCIGAIGWLLFVLLFTKSMGKIQHTVLMKHPKKMTLVSTAAMIGAFGALSMEQMVISPPYFMTGIVAIITMYLMQFLASKFNKKWVKEWALGISMLMGMIGGYLTSLI